MLNNEITWQTGPSSAIRSTFILGLLATLWLIFAVQYCLENYGRHYSSIISAFALAVLLCITSVLRLFFTRFLLKTISIGPYHLIIPRIFLRDYKVHINDITALDIFGKPNTNRVALIIRRTEPPIAVSENLFTCTTHFDEFVSHVDKSLNSKEDSRKKKKLSSSLATHMTSIVLATTLTIPFVTLSDDLGTLNNTALQLGGLTKSALQPNELYRLFSAFFLHFSLPHLAVNLFTLGIFLHPVEILIGRAKVINVLLISALGGSVGSIIFSPFEIVAGASGGILGLIASYTVLHFKCREKMIGFVFIPHNVLLLIIVGQIASDLLFDGIDLYSHLFGFLVGAIYTNFASRSGLLPNGTRHNNFACLLSFVLTAIFLVGAVYFGIRCMR